MSKFAAIVLSAGVGSRMKSDIPKQYMDLAGKPVIYYSLKAFEDAGFSSIVLVCGKEDVEYCKIVTLIEEIAGVNDTMRDLFLELSNIIALREFKGKQTIIDGNFNIKSADLGKFKESLEEIRRFVLFV
jgi:CTP:phosphocholine cytidylyltransferase-like protein